MSSIPEPGPGVRQRLNACAPSASAPSREVCVILRVNLATELFKFSAMMPLAIVPATFGWLCGHTPATAALVISLTMLQVWSFAFWRLSKRIER